MNRTEQKRSIYQHFAAVAKALGHEYRWELLELIAQGERSVESLSQGTELAVATVSQHLQQMRRAGLVRSRKEGRFMYYGLADDRVISLMAGLREVAERNIAEVRQLVDSFHGDGSELDAVDADELMAQIESGGVTLLDVRPEQEYSAGHLPGALNIPVEELQERLRELPEGQTIVAYCRGPFCALSEDAVQLLREQGIAAVRFDSGYPEWKASGLPVQ
ncbi:ArsR family transcriptional regulator [Halospina denitrificans]|uniref:ArsR family transcriptional regulator n=1 Tax=Halospina denitrificans TaxID=332522 RepID=A0A4R7JQN4_9GAMM|nr:metalloregulator ArsR/SmtB family transcription factor [Halospina denitrificans]TDT40235.1 ArsR family transcriptional regulator [Halospina denitrificans]